jgi:hypothetical protein
MTPWSHLSGVLDLMFRGNFPDWYIKGRNRTFTRPSSPSVSQPAKFFYWDYEADNVEVKTVGRTRIIRGRVRGIAFVEGNAGDAVIDSLLDQVDTIADAWAEQGEAASTLYFYGVLALAAVYDGDADKPNWCQREWDLEFLYLSPVSDQGVGILAGISTSTISIPSAGLARLDFVGVNAGVWQRVKAEEGQPSCLGMVTGDPEGGNVLVTLSGFVRVPGHGLPIGPLYLSQDTAGAGTSTVPDSGVARKVAEVLDANDLIVLGELPEVVL